MSRPIVIIGDVLIDVLLDEHSSQAVPGGSALNTAVGLSILGIRPALVGVIGDDDNGTLIRSYLNRYDVDFYPTVSPLGTGQAISTRHNGEPQYHFNAAFKERQINFTDTISALISGAELVAISGFPFDSTLQTTALLASLDRTRGLIAVDPNPRPALIENADMFRDSFSTLAKRADLVKISNEDAALLYHMPLHDAVKHIRSFSAATILGTEGPGGAFADTHSHHVHRPIVTNQQPIVDTMGAGDATFASVLHDLSHTPPDHQPDWAKTLDRAMHIATATIRHPGALLTTPPQTGTTLPPG